MLTFLYVASRKGFEISAYEDEAVGVMTKNERGIHGSVPSPYILASRTAATESPLQKRKPGCTTMRMRGAS
jgi:hypothetical protein